MSTHPHKHFVSHWGDLHLEIFVFLHPPLIGQDPVIKKDFAACTTRCCPRTCAQSLVKIHQQGKKCIAGQTIAQKDTRRASQYILLAIGKREM